MSDRRYRQPLESTTPTFHDYSEADNAFHITPDENQETLSYKIKSPLQITLAHCSGTDKEDYVNFYTISTEKSFYYQQYYGTQSHLYRCQPLHSHDYFEMAIILEGELIQNIENKEYFYHAGACCLTNRNLHHAENFLSEGTVLFVGISVPLMEELLSMPNRLFAEEADAIRPTLLYQFIHSDLRNPGVRAYLDYIPALQNQNSYEFLHSFSHNMINTLLSPYYGVTYRLKELLCSLLWNLCDSAYYHCTQVQLDYNADYLIFSRISHLLEECDGRMSRKELENNLHYSGNYLNRIVKKYTGMSLYDYGMTFCLKKAAELLITTSETVSSIAAQLHFSNRSHFYKLFSKAYGVTPKEYRLESPLR